MILIRCGLRLRLPSSDHGLSLPRRRFGGLKKTCGNLVVSAHSISEPGIDDAQSNKIKHCRRIATRYDKLTADYLAFVKLASIRIWLRANESTP
jgi:transposase